MNKIRRALFFFCITSWFNKMNFANPSKNNVGVITDEIFLEKIFSDNHPEKPERLKFFQNEIYNHPQYNKKIFSLRITEYLEELIFLIHSQKHVQLLKQNYSKAILNIATRAVDATLSACDHVHSGMVKRVFVASRPPGHHAQNHGVENGFCFFNNIAIAARYLQKNLGYKKILILDWDYHHGDGTEFFFYDDPTVLFCSIHDQHAYPGTGDPNRTGQGKGLGFNFNIHLPCGSTDKEFKSVFLRRIIPEIRAFKPNFILVSAGFDSRVDDPLGCFNFSDNGFKEVTQLLVKLSNEYAEGKIVSVLEGGYNPNGITKSMVAHIEGLFDN